MVLVDLSKTELDIILRDLRRPFIFQIEELHDPQSIKEHNLRLKLAQARYSKRSLILATFDKKLEPHK